ncbi:hypothetical protein GQ53DRAFT_166624 [Thozetella sp. PMI_491]|nr:hypothetical protein GQ53DRAFT_166624 [Thozetella sp. PMI_491]
MAVVAPPPFKRNFWGSSESAIYPAEAPAPMTDIMPYQYPPPPPSNGADMDLPPPAGYYSVPPPSDMRQGPDADLHSKDRRDSLSKTMKLKRSLSTPSVRPPQPQPPSQQPGPPPNQQPHPQSAQDQAALALAGEKRRNKLGYHRTSVACGHCRRRKIRCIPSPNDHQGRCINCIRLKKDCSFYPVDQQPPQDARQKSASRSSVGPKMASNSSSPALQTGLPSDMHGQSPYPPQLTMPSISSMAPPMKPPGSDSFSPDSKLPSSATGARQYEYGHHGINWMSADASPNSSKPGDLSATWRTYPSESPITPAFSPFTPHAPPPSATWPTPVSAESAPREDIPWSSYPQPPPRSLSFGAESMASHTPQQYPPISQISSHASRPYERKSSSMSADMYPPPSATTIPGIETVPGTTLDHNVSLSAGAVPPPNYGSWQQQPYSYSKPPEGYAGWYGEQGQQQLSPSGNQPGDHHPPSGSSMYYGDR